MIEATTTAPVAVADITVTATPTTTRHAISLGNVQERSGHRADCAQVTVVATVEAPTREVAVELVKAALSAPLNFEVGGVKLAVIFNVGRIR